MAMGIVSDDEFESEIENLNRNKNVDATIAELPHPGRQEGDNNVPDSLRKIIGETSEIEGRQEAIELAKQFGISGSSVSAYANGSHSTSSYDRQPNLNHINRAKERIGLRARKTLMRALSSITPDKLAESDAKELAGVARDMSAIVKDMEPETLKNPENSNSPTFVIYSPQFKEEKHFEIINLRE